MAIIEVTIRDDQGNILQQTKTTKYPLNLGKKSLHEIEGAVENWKQEVLPDIEGKLLCAAQVEFTQEKKNRSGNM